MAKPRKKSIAIIKSHDFCHVVLKIQVPNKLKVMAPFPSYSDLKC